MIKYKRDRSFAYLFAYSLARSKQNTQKFIIDLDFIHSQAALAPVALDLVRQKNLPELYGLANIVLIVSVLAIILTAPVGAIIMVKFAPKFLQPAPNDGR